MAQTKIEQGLLKFTEATDYLKIPTGTTAQRPSSPANGYIRFNTTINDVEAYNGTEWVGMSISPPTFASIDYPGTATALDPAGNESLVINGSNFVAGITLTIGGTTPSSITLNSSTQLTVTTPVKTAGTYDIVFTNADGGTATATNAVSYNGIPAFTNAAGSLGSVEEESAVNLSVAATEPDGGAITYAITSGALPTGLSLNASTGAITGTAPSVSANTTSNFTVTATDNENQTSSRAYSITVTNIGPSSFFNTVTYTGDGASTKSITGVGFKPDMVWIKARTSAYSHNLQDSTRGGGTDTALNPNLNLAEGDYGIYGFVNTFDTDGFTVGTGSSNNVHVNNSGTDYVAWCWKANGGTTSSNTSGTITSTVQANNTLGFSIISYNGNGTSGATIGHGLSAAPDLLIFKRLNAAESWNVWSSSVSSKVGFLNLSAAFINYSVLGAGASTITLNNGTGHNASGSPYICYAFASVAGFSSIGSYTGNGSTTGTIVNTGFEPAFILGVKVSGDNWWMFDNKRSTTNPRNASLFPNSDSAELGGGYIVDFLSNGFQLKTTDGAMNANGSQYIYIAFAANPDTTAPTLADSFNTVTYTGNGGSQSITGLGFSPNLVFLKMRNNPSTYISRVIDSVRGATKEIYAESTLAENTETAGVLSLDSDGFTLGTNAAYNNNGTNFVAWAWKADDALPTINTNGSINSIVSANANAGFSIVQYDGSLVSGSNTTIGHGLSVAPELIILKVYESGLTASSWFVYSSAVGSSYEGVLNTTGAFTVDTNRWNNTAPTSTVFSVGSSFSTYPAYYGGDTIAYCFHSVSGYSKIGSYSGSGYTTNTIITGFQPDFVMIKAYTNSSTYTSWTIFDSVRYGGSSDTNPIYANLSAAEGTRGNGSGDGDVLALSFTSTGFQIINNASDELNDGNKQYIYMAFKIN